MEDERAKQERKRKEEAEAHLYIVIKVARDEDLVEQIGREIYFDLVNHDKVRNFRIRKHVLFSQFKEQVAKEFGVPVQFQRFWLWAKRQNLTYRPRRPLTPLEEIQHVDNLREVSNKADLKELKPFLEVEVDSDLRPIAPPTKTTEDVLLFFKLYDPSREELRYVGRLFAKLSGKPIEILTRLNKMAGFRPNEKIQLFEEIMFEPRVMCEPIDNEVTFRGNQLQDGDIICFQKSQTGISEQCRYPNVQSFFQYLRECKAGESVKAQQEPKPVGSQTTAVPYAHVTEPLPTPGSRPHEQSTQVAIPSTESSQQREQVTLTARDALEAKTTTVPSALPIVGPASVQPSQEPTVVEATIDSSSFAFTDALFADIQNLLDEKTSEADTSSNAQPSVLSIDEIANAKKIFQQCLGMQLASVIKLGRTHEFKNSVSVMINIVNAFPNRMIDKLTKLLHEFDQNCQQYVRAEQELKEIEQKESSITELKTTSKQLFCEFMPIRNRSDQVKQEIYDLERQLAERKAEMAKLGSNLEDLTRRASTSKHALINAEQEMKKFKPKKEEAKKTIGDMERSWQSLKVDCDMERSWQSLKVDCSLILP